MQTIMLEDIKHDTQSLSDGIHTWTTIRDNVAVMYPMFEKNVGYIIVVNTKTRERVKVVFNDDECHCHQCCGDLDQPKKGV